MYRGSPASRRSVGAIVAMAIAIGLMAFGALATASADEEVCSPGAHTLSQFGDHVYPEMGNGGYKSLHTDVNLVYDAIQNEFLPGNNVVLTQVSTQCLSYFSLDFSPQTPDNEEGPGADMQVQKVFVNGEEAAFGFVQPTYPGDPNGQDDPDPAAHQTGQNATVSATNPLPPACSPEANEAAANGLPCPARKLVITPAAPIPSGETFVVKVEYTGKPGVYTDGGGEAEGWFLSDEPAGDGSFVTTEPVGTEAWMPLNNHPSVKPTYDFNEKVTKGRTVIANGELVKPEGGGLAEDNPPDDQFPEGSTTWRWHSPEPIANYLVENSVGDYELLERKAAGGVIYYQAQGGAIPAAKKAANKAIMDQQEDITTFQERFNGPYPFTTDGVVIGVPSASFEEEMQGKITFNGGAIGLNTFNHENMHQWWGDNVSESNFNETFFKEGFARLSEYLATARTAATNAGGLDTPAGQAAFDGSLVNRFNTNYNVNGTMWTRAPSNPTPATLFATATTYNRSATTYLAVRQILGDANFVSALKQVQAEFGGSSIEESELEAVFKEWLPNQSSACVARLNTFFGEWFDTVFPAAGTVTRPQLTGPGLPASASGTTFYSAVGPCSAVTPVTTAKVLPELVDGSVKGSATVVLTAKDANSTEYSLDGADPQLYDGPFAVSALGEHTIEFHSTSRDGDVEKANSITFTVLTHDPPVTTAKVLPEPVDGQVTGPATVVLSASENGGGVQSTEYSVDDGPFQDYAGPFTVAGFADHTVQFRSTNGEGAVEETKSVSFTVLPHPAPTTTATVQPKPVDGNVVGPATITLAAKDNGGGIASTEFKIDNGNFETYEEPFTVTGFADHTVEFRSTNGDGAVEETKSVSFTVVPHAAPTTTATVLPEPVDGKVTGPARVVLSAQGEGADITGTEFKLDDGAFGAYDGPFTVSQFGQHTVEYRSRNSDGALEDAKSITFTVLAHDAPVTTAHILPAPAGGKITGPGTVVLSATNPGIDVTKTEFSLDRGVFQPYLGPITVATLGAHTIEYRSTNAEGTVETAKQVSFTVVAAPGPPAAKPACQNPHLTIAVSHPLRKRKGVPTLQRGKAYQFTGRLTCGPAGAPAPANTVVQVFAGSVQEPSVVVGADGKIKTLLQVRRGRAIAFRYSADGGSAEAKVKVAVARR